MDEGMGSTNSTNADTNNGTSSTTELYNSSTYPTITTSTIKNDELEFYLGFMNSSTSQSPITGDHHEWKVTEKSINQTFVTSTLQSIVHSGATMGGNLHIGHSNHNQTKALSPSSFFEATEDWSSLQLCYTVIPLTIIIICIVLGNLLVVVSILSQKNLRTPSNVYIFSLALTDLLVGIFILPFNIHDMIHGWTSGMTLCKIWLTLDVTLCSSSILHITAIAVDRFRSINEGLSYAMSRTILSSTINCAALWFLALWIASPPVLGWNDWKHDIDLTECHLSTTLGYIVHSATGAFFIPAMVMSGLYVRIYFLLRKKFRERAEFHGLKNGCQMEQLSSHDLDQSSATIVDIPAPKKSKDTEKSKENLTDTEENKKGSSTLKGRFTLKRLTSTMMSRESSSSSTDGRKHSEQITGLMKKKVKYSLSKERKAATTLAFLIGAFLICWTPFTLTYLLMGILGEEQFAAHVWFQYATWLGYVNSAVNPIIYNAYNVDFKHAFMKIVFFWRRTGRY